MSPFVRQFDAAHGDVFAGRHFVAHEVLKDDADLAVQILDAVVAQVHAVQQDPALGGVVQAREQFDDRGLALPVFADQRDAFAAFRCEGPDWSSTRRGLPG